MIFDALVLAAVILSAIIAFLRGFIREFLTIVGVAGGLLAAYAMGPKLQPVMRGWLDVESPEALAEQGKEGKKLFDLIPMSIVADILAYGLVFLVVVIVLSVISHLLSGGAKALGLGPVDRILGALFGVARAVFLLALLYLPVYMLTSESDRDEWFESSRTRPHIERAAQWMESLLPEQAGENLENATDEAGEKLNETQRRLHDMQVLKNAGDKLESMVKDKDQEKQPDAAPSETGPGYDSRERETMDRLIENNDRQSQNP